MAMVTAGFTGGEAEELRRAFGFKRSRARHGRGRGEAARRHGAPGHHGRSRPRPSSTPSPRSRSTASPKSHAASFALLAYASAYLKAHHPAAFYAALLNNQPMGFYHPATIVQDAAAPRAGDPARRRDSLGLALRDRAGRRRAARAALRARAAGRGGAAARGGAPAAALRLGGRSGAARRAAPRRAGAARAGSARSRASSRERRAALWEAERAGRPAGALYEDLPAPREPSPLRPMTRRGAAGRRLRGHRPHARARTRWPSGAGALARMGVSRAADLAAFRHGASVRWRGRWWCASGPAPPRASYS